MLVSLSPRATQHLLLRSCQRVGGASAVARQLGKASSTKSATRQFYMTCSRARPSVIPALRQRRPSVRGEAVAFHVRDLEPGGITRAASLVHHAPAAALQQDDDLYDDDSATSGDYYHSTSRPQREYDSDLVVVLDMDECLIHSQFLTNNPGAKFYAHQVTRNSASKNEHGKAERVDSFRFHLPDGDLVQVNKRPFLEEFLQAVTDKYETHIFTAAMQVYAEPILDMLDPDGDRFAQRWYRESCDLDTNLGAYVKNLSSLPLNNTKDNNIEDGPQEGFYSYEEYMNRTSAATAAVGSGDTPNMRRVVLVDNNPLSFLANPTNGILVSSFYNDPSDKTLPAVIELLQELDPLEDVRPTLDSRFGLKAALSEVQGNQGGAKASNQKYSQQWK